MSECCSKRLEQLEAEVGELRAAIATIHEENLRTVEAMKRTIQSAEGFRDRVFAVLEKQTGKTIN